MDEVDGFADYVLVWDGKFKWACEPVRGIWKCGKCMRGNLGPTPKTADSCRVCHCEVLTVSKKTVDMFMARYPYRRA